MCPFLLRFGDFAVPSYPIFLALGIAAGFWTMLALGVKDGLSPRKMAHLFVLAAGFFLVGGYLCSLVGAHLAHSHVPDMRAGQTFYGGALGALIGVLGMCKVLQLPVACVCDSVAIAAPLAGVFGRLGCFMHGCCYGRVTSLPWGVIYRLHIDLSGEVYWPPAYLSHLKRGLIAETARASLPVHPTQIYSCLGHCLAFVLMLCLRRKGYCQGRLLIVYAIVYAGSRFVLEYYREQVPVLERLTMAQLISLGILIAGVPALALVCQRRSRPQPHRL